MKKSIIKVVLSIISIIIIYYLLSITLTNNGQFVNHYFYPSSSIKESKEHSIFLEKISENLIVITGNQNFKEFVNTKLDLWVDKFKVNKSYGLFNLFSYDKFENEKRVLRIGYKNENKKYSTSYEQSIWVDYNDKLLESLSTTTGRGYYVNSSALLSFFEDESKSKYQGSLKISIN